MTDVAVVTDVETRAPATTLRWWREVLYVLAFYGVYSAVRNTQGSAAVSARHAFNNAKQIIGWEEWLHIYNEEAVQQAFLGARGFIQFWNVYYGTAHFVVTAGALIWLFRRRPERYALWRNTLAWTTGLALIGFALYPLMPPRLLPPSYGFVDTLKEIGGLWSFDSGAMAKVSNQYAAMPSLHAGWDLLVGIAIITAASGWVLRVVGAVLPVLMAVAVITTGNHYFVDVPAGLALALVGYAVSGLLARRRLGRAATTGPEAGTTPQDSQVDRLVDALHR